MRFDSGPAVFVCINRNNVLTEYVLNENHSSSGYQQQLTLTDKRYVCIKPCRPPTTNAHALVVGTGTAFRQVHGSEQPYARISKKETSLGVRGQLMRSLACPDPKRRILPLHSSRQKHVAGF